MGLLDNIFKSLDETLKAVEDGAIEKTLNNAIDMFDAKVGSTLDSAQKLAELPEKALNTAAEKADAIENQAGNLQNQAGRVMDVVRPKESV